MTRPLIGSLAVVLLCLMLSQSAAAQAPDETVLVATPTVDGIDIYSADSSGEVTLVRSLTGFRVGDPIDQASWFIEERANLTVSLNGRKIAFTAQRNGDWVLFVYTLETDVLREIPIPTAFIPVWSPDGNSILLLPAPSSQPPYHVYVYDASQDRSFRLTTEQVLENYFRWLPDSSGLIYIGPSVSCDECSYYVADLYYISRYGENRRALTNLFSQVPEQQPITICDPTWSEPNQRIYYIVGCVSGGDISNEYLYSVDLVGNNRAEISLGLSGLYPGEENVSTINIHPDPFTQDIYLTVRSRGEVGPNNANWRVLQVTSPDLVRTVYERTGRLHPLQSSALSPSGTRLTLVSRAREAQLIGFLEVIEVSTGERIVSDTVTPLEVCQVTWIDENTLFYAVDPTGACDVARAPQSIWVLDVASSTTQEVTSELGANVWMLRRVVVTAPLS